MTVLDLIGRLLFLIGSRCAIDVYRPSALRCGTIAGSRSTKLIASHECMVPCTTDIIKFRVVGSAACIDGPAISSYHDK